MEMHETVGIVIPEVLILQDALATVKLVGGGGQLTLRRQSHRRDVFSTPLNLRVFDSALSRLVWHSMAGIWSRRECEAEGFRLLGAYVVAF
jgi:hypothetical protein